jgi:hypothetical protein
MPSVMMNSKIPKPMPRGYPSEPVLPMVVLTKMPPLFGQND